MTDADIIAKVIADEGGERVTGDPDELGSDRIDPGGITRWGITIPGFTEYLKARSGNQKAQATPEDIRALSQGNAEAFYNWLMDSTNVRKIASDVVRYFTFDAVVNMGASEGITLLQRAIGATEDGKLGPNTLASIPYRDGALICARMAFHSVVHYGAWCVKDADRLRYLNGLNARVGRKLKACSA